MFWRSERGARAWAGAALGGFLLAGCANVERNFPNKSALNYRLDQARFDIDKLAFDDAIEAITPMVIKYPKNASVAYIASMAYSGRAGLRILDLFSDIASKVSSTGLLAIIAQAYPASTATTMADIESALVVLENYGARAANRTDAINFYALFLYYSRIGIVLNRYAYLSDTNELDPSFVACSVSKFPDAAVDVVMTTLPRIVDTASSIAASGSGFDELRAIDTLVPAGLSFDPIPCSANSDAAYCLAVRNLIAVGKSAGGIGLGTGEAVCAPTIP